MPRVHGHAASVVGADLTYAVAEACRVGAQHLAGLWGHPDQDEGPRAFAEKREPNWAPYP